jgi:hypothetical protein
MFAETDQMTAVENSWAASMNQVVIPLVMETTLIGFPAAVLSLLLRFRSSSAVQRQQIKWFLYSGALYAILLVLGFLFLTQPGTLPLGLLFYNVLLAFAAAGMLVAIGFAIFRHRLYDIDLIIRRTLVYTLLTAVLGLVYAGSVILLQAPIRFLAPSSSPLVVVLSTLFTAALFTPLRARIQGAIDRRFFRRRYNIEHTLADFSANLRSEVDPDQLSLHLLHLADKSLQPSNVSVWLVKQKQVH